MFPFLIQKGSFTIPTFSFMLMLASLCGTFYAYYRAPGKQLSQTVVLDLGIIGTIAAIVGARLFHVFVEEPHYYWEHPTHIFQIWRGGFVSYGAIILIGVSVFIYLRKRKLDILKYLDLLALTFPIIIFFVRLGCLGAGCCYGKPTDFFVHLIFRNPASDAGSHFYGISLHATQVYGMLNAILLFVILHLIDRKQKFKGQLIWSFLILYGLVRGFIEEPLRGDVERGVYFNGLISTGQIMSLLAILFGIFMYYYCRRRAQQLPQICNA
jgi:phosphatidylglycerol:prolipoprotein diacylglycerol transferase